MPSTRAHRRKNRHGSRSCETSWLIYERIHQDLTLHFEPDDDQVPKADQTEFGCREPVPSFGIFDGHHIHIMEDELHRQQTHEKADGISNY